MFDSFHDAIKQCFMSYFPSPLGPCGRWRIEKTSKVITWVIYDCSLHIINSELSVNCLQQRYMLDISGFGLIGH